MRRGWSINVSRDDHTTEVYRDHEPVLVLDDGELVFEVWFWHSALRRYFVMTRGPHMPHLLAKGVVFFSPDEVPEVLRARLEAMERIAS